MHKKLEALKANSSIKAFIYAIENELYVEAHELLEDDWREYKKKGKKKEAKAVQGLINGATALALYFTKQRPHAYEKVWPVFEKYKDLLNQVEFEDMQSYKKARDLLIKINNGI